MDEGNDIAILIVAGGKATRCPGKLERPFGRHPMIVQSYRNLCGRHPLYISIHRPFSGAVAAQLNALMVVDRRPDRGPLCGLVSTMARMTARRAFVVAGDMPLVDLGVLDDLRKPWRPNDQALTAVDPLGIPQPLLALYDRNAFLRAFGSLGGHDGGAVSDVLGRLRWRGVTLRQPERMLNVNTEDDYRAALKRLSKEHVPV